MFLTFVMALEKFLEILIIKGTNTKKIRVADVMFHFGFPVWDAVQLNLVKKPNQ